MPHLTVAGRRFFYLEDDFADPWVPHDTVLVQPYLLGTHRDLQRYVPVLARYFRVVRIDRYGLGGSEVPPYGHEFRLEEILADLVGCLDALGIEKLHYVGDSFGAILGVALAVHHPERLRSVVLINCLHSINHATQQTATAGGYEDAGAAVYAMGSWAFAHERLVQAPALQGVTVPALQIRRAEDESKVPPQVHAGLTQMAFDPSFDITELLSSISAPTLLISPDGSYVTSVEQQADIASRIPNCRQEIIPWAETEWVDLLEPALRAVPFLLEHAQHAA